MEFNFNEWHEKRVCKDSLNVEYWTEAMDACKRHYEQQDKQKDEAFNSVCEQLKTTKELIGKLKPAFEYCHEKTARIMRLLQENKKLKELLKETMPYLDIVPTYSKDSDVIILYNKVSEIVD